jgi:hypothetical protein
MQCVYMYMIQFFPVLMFFLSCTILLFPYFKYHLFIVYHSKSLILWDGGSSFYVNMRFFEKKNRNVNV